VCQFCVEHGEGERWYLNAKNYAHDLQSDLERRDYVVRFIADFGANRARAIRWLDAASVLPKPLRKTATAVASRRMQPHHFGQPVPIEECEQIFSLATSITVIPCICRMHAPGKNADEVCVLVTTQPMETYLAEGFRDYEDGPELGDFHKMSRDEAMDLLRECESKGLMHSVWTFETPFTAAICNCNLESGCMAMRLTAGYEMKMMWRGESVAIRDPDLCTVCGRCAKICPFEAIASAPSHVEVQADRCWGCGICRSVCRADALTLVDRRTIPAVATLW
jgi:Pyruvate/2-oxoacid:ferredoxin oxidoreductase delta subunit